VTNGIRERLIVYLGAQQIGELERQGPTRYRFTYDNKLVVEPGEGAILLSASLPVRPQTYPNARAKPFFEGLLPEGAVRREVARALGVSEANGFGLLRELGADCAGAVVVLRPDTELDEAAGRIKWLSDEQIEELLKNLRRHPLGIAPEEGIRLSLAGLQEKLIVTRAANGSIGQPIHGTPSTHIIKPAQNDYPGIVENEAFCLRVAARVGLPAARAEIRSFGAIQTLIVERFDRTISDSGSIVRLHQEDFCQALGVLPTAKYENEGGPSITGIAALLRELGDARDLRNFSLAILVNFLLGNSDAHGKNFALLYDQPGRVRLAPAYDVVSTNVYDGLTTRLAMSIDGVEDPTRVTADNWNRMLAAAGFRPQRGQLERALRQVKEGVDATLEVARAEGWHRSVLDDIFSVVEERSGQLV
jgi:serine/threonine-protein kinase HipA